MCIVPVTVPVPSGKNPVTVEPGLTPMSPLTTVYPVFIMEEPARIAKLLVEFISIGPVSLTAKTAVIVWLAVTFVKV
jgi:hypothetical protein